MLIIPEIKESVIANNSIKFLSMFLLPFWIFIRRYVRIILFDKYEVTLVSYDINFSDKLLHSLIIRKTWDMVLNNFFVRSK